GVRRETSADVAARWRAEAGPRLTDAEPCRIVFSLGVNDCVSEGGLQRVAPAQTLLHVRAMLTEAAGPLRGRSEDPPFHNGEGTTAKRSGVGKRGSSSEFGVSSSIPQLRA